MTATRQIAWWAFAALLSLALVGSLAVWQSRELARAKAAHVISNPETGSAVFRTRGCVACHGKTGVGKESGTALRDSGTLSTLPRLVTAMWNHAPRMWEAMRVKQLPYPTLTHEETAQLVTYLYMSGYADSAGDPVHGEKVYKERKCARCHADNNDVGGATHSIAASDDPLSWIEVLWNHASAMDARMKAMGVAWPRFQASDLRDLHAYLRERANPGGSDPPDITGDPERGWDLFQQKGCISCHTLWPQPARVGPSLGPERALPNTFSDFGAALLTHFPQMENAIRKQDSPMPQLQGNDLADIAAFLYSLHYLEPSGSPQVGKSVFAWRGCSRCHGEEAEGTAKAPGLRGRGQTYTSIRLATDLWRHGARMYQTSVRNGQSWPVLRESDIGHLLTFLNTSPQR